MMKAKPKTSRDKSINIINLMKSLGFYSIDNFVFQHFHFFYIILEFQKGSLDLILLKILNYLTHQIFCLGSHYSYYLFCLSSHQRFRSYKKLAIFTTNVDAENHLCLTINVSTQHCTATFVKPVLCGVISVRFPEFHKVFFKILIHVVANY
jgi:hypothetical protein